MSQFFTTELAALGGLHFITVKSNALGQRVDMTVYYPESAQPLHDLPVVILLHGVYGSHWAWALKGQAHQTLQRLMAEGSVGPMVLAMPSDGLYADGSGYLRHRHANYERWIVEEVISVLKEQFGGVSEISPVFIAGLSMGGYGAMRLGAKYPQVFRAFSGHSSITEFKQMAGFVQDFGQLKRDVLAEENVLEWLLAHASQLPPFRFDCGTDDTLLSANRALHEALLQHKLPHIYEEFSGGHSWDYWQTQLERSLLFFESLR